MSIEMARILSLVLNDLVMDGRVQKIAGVAATKGQAMVACFGSVRNRSTDWSGQSFKVWYGAVYNRPDRKIPRLLQQFASTLKYSFSILFKSAEPTVIIANDLETLPLAVLLKTRFMGRPAIVYDSHELQTETIGSRGLKKKFKQIVERWAIRYSVATFVVSDSIADWYRDVYQQRSVSVVRNMPKGIGSADFSREKLRRSLGLAPDSLLFLYQGGFLPGRGILMAIEAFSQLPAQNQSIVFLGYGPLREKMLSRVHELGLQGRAFVLDAVPNNELLEYTASADVGLCLIEPVCESYRLSLPNKLFEFLAAGLPVIATDLPDFRRWVDQGRGWLVQPDDLQGLVRAMAGVSRKAAGEMSRAIAGDREKFLWSSQVSCVERTFETALHSVAS